MPGIEMVDSHWTFWDCSEVKIPLIDFFIGSLFPLEEFRGGLSDGFLTPEMLIPESFEEYYRNIGFFVPERRVLYNTAFPFMPIPWMEAIMGCPIKVSLNTNSVGSHPFLNNLMELDKVEEKALDPENPWLLKLLEFQRFLIDLFKCEQAVGLPIMRGPTDLAGAMLGGQKMVFEFYDHPNEMERLLKICSKVWMQTAQAQIEIIPKFREGYFNYRLINSPTPSPVLQEDNAAFISPSIYKQFVLPHDLRILRKFNNPFFHTHSSSAHILLDELLTTPEVKAIDSCWDLPPFGPPVGKLLPSYHKIQEAGKSLYILAVGNPAEEELLRLIELSPRGLCIFFQAPDSKTGHRIAKKLESMWC